MRACSCCTTEVTRTYGSAHEGRGLTKYLTEITRWPDGCTTSKTVRLNY